MKTLKAVAQKQKKLTTEFQKSLGETIVLLLEFKTKAGISKITKLKIDAAVRELQEIIITIPDIVANRKSFSKVFDAISKMYNIYCRAFL